jgi:ubiquitin-conjugating enzyme E2 variant
LDHHMYVYLLDIRGVGLHCAQSVHENRIYSVKMHCGPDYPDIPPEISFTSKINLPCVNAQNGKVYNTALQYISIC